MTSVTSLYDKMFFEHDTFPFGLISQCQSLLSHVCKKIWLQCIL